MVNLSGNDPTDIITSIDVHGLRCVLKQLKITTLFFVGFLSIP